MPSSVAVASTGAGEAALQLKISPVSKALKGFIKTDLGQTKQLGQMQYHVRNQRNSK